MHSRLKLSLVTAACIFAACSTPKQTEVEPVQEKKPSVAIRSLDANGDGSIGVADSLIFATISELARAKLSPASLETLDKALYVGPGEGGFEGLFSTVVDGTAKPSLTGLEDSRLYALSAEAMWFKNKAKLCSNSNPAETGWSCGGKLADNFSNYSSDAMTPATICDGIAALNLESFTSQGVKPAAVLDLDNTVWSGHAVDPFLAALIELEVIPESSNPILKRVLSKLEQIDAATVEANSVNNNAKLFLERSRSKDLPKGAKVNRKDQFFLIAEIMGGLTPEVGDRVAKHFFQVGTSEYPAWKEQIFATEGGCGMKEIIAKMKAQGLDVYFISASLDVIVSAAGDFLGVDKTHRKGSPMEIKDGVYTGKVESIYVLKAPVVRAWLGAPPLLAFGDSARSDFGFMADTAGTAFMINPDEGFLTKETEQVAGRFVSVNFTNTIGSLSAKNAPTVP